MQFRFSKLVCVPTVKPWGPGSLPIKPKNRVDWSKPSQLGRTVLDYLRSIWTRNVGGFSGRYRKFNFAWSGTIRGKQSCFSSRHLNTPESSLFGVIEASLVLFL